MDKKQTKIMDKETEDTCERGIYLTREYLENIQSTLQIRKKTIKELNEIASAVEVVNQDFHATVVGFTQGAGDTAALHKSEVAFAKTDPEKRPISEKSYTYGKQICEGNLKMATDTMYKDKETVLSVKKVHTKLHEIAKDLAPKLNKEKNEIIGYLFSHAMANKNVVSDLLSKQSEIGFKPLSMSTELMKIGEKVSLFDVWHAVDRVQTKRNPPGSTEIQKELNAIANQLSNEIESLENALRKMRKASEQNLEDIKKIGREKMNKFLEKVAVAKEMNQDDVAVFRTLAKFSTTNDWSKAFFSLDGGLMSYLIQGAAKFYNFFMTFIGQEFEAKRRKLDSILVTLIAHGKIDTNPLFPTVPCSLFFPTTYLEKITFYQPWGYEIGADVVLGILNNSININDVRYEPHTIDPPFPPSVWNDLPKSADINIRSPVFSPVRATDEPVLQLNSLLTTHPAIRTGTVILYDEGRKAALQMGDDTHLFLLTTALGLAGYCLDTNIEFRYAACLVPSHLNNWPVVINQYHRHCGNQFTEIPIMRWNFLPDEQEQQFLNALERVGFR